MNQVESQHVLEVGTDDNGLRCLFPFSGERFTHTIARLKNGSATPVLESQATGDETWPASPPWQELHVHRQADGSPALMLVGKAGRSHWSMSVTVEKGALLFDVACRYRKVPSFLGETYRIVSQLGDVAVTPIVSAEDGVEVTMNRSADRFAIEAAELPAPPATVRWAYRVSLDSMKVD